MISRLTQFFFSMISTFSMSILLAAIVSSAADAEYRKAEIQVIGPSGSRSYDLEALEALPTVEIRTRTPWHDDVVVYRGVRVADLMEDSGNPAPGTLRITALNDYSVSVNFKELVETGAIIATRMNGTTISIVRKGPLLIVFPWTDNPELKNEKYFSLAVWYLKEISVK